MDFNNQYQLLQEVYHGAKMGDIAIRLLLPKVDNGDLLVIHDTGAHGFSMGYNYNGKLRSAELLLQADGGVRLIRRAETPEDYFSTAVWE